MSRPVHGVVVEFCLGTLLAALCMLMSSVIKSLALQAALPLGGKDTALHTALLLGSKEGYTMACRSALHWVVQ